MPFKSKAQRAKFAAMVSEGKMSQETFNRWERETGKEDLPERSYKSQKSIKRVRKARTIK